MTIKSTFKYYVCMGKELDRKQMIKDLCRSICSCCINMEIHTNTLHLLRACAFDVVFTLFILIQYGPLRSALRCFLCFGWSNRIRG